MKDKLALRAVGYSRDTPDPPGGRRVLARPQGGRRPPALLLKPPDAHVQVGGVALQQVGDIPAVQDTDLADDLYLAEAGGAQLSGA